MAGCGPSREESPAQKEAERKEQLRKEQQEIQGKISEKEREFNAIYFPPTEIRETSFTYEIQKFFEVHADDAIIFKGHLEDIEASENNVLVEFVYPFGDYLYGTKIAIRFKLTSTENNIDKLLKAKRRVTWFGSLSHRYYVEGPDYFVIAKIKNLQRVRNYEFSGSASGEETFGEEVEIQPEDSRILIATGDLLKAIFIKDPNRGKTIQNVIDSVKGKASGK